MLKANYYSNTPRRCNARVLTCSDIPSSLALFTQSCTQAAEYQWSTENQTETSHHHINLTQKQNFTYDFLSVLKRTAKNIRKHYKRYGVKTSWNMAAFQSQI